MEFVISFFRDFLSGPLYIVIAITSVIGICACIGYLAETQLKAKEERARNDAMYAHVHLLPVDGTTGLQPVSNVQTAYPSAQLESIGQVATTNLAQNTVVSSTGTQVSASTVHSATSSGPAAMPVGQTGATASTSMSVGMPVNQATTTTSTATPTDGQQQQ